MLARGHRATTGGTTLPEEVGQALSAAPDSVGNIWRWRRRHYTRLSTIAPSYLMVRIGLILAYGVGWSSKGYSP